MSGSNVSNNFRTGIAILLTAAVTWSIPAIGSGAGRTESKSAAAAGWKPLKLTEGWVATQIDTVCSGSTTCAGWVAPAYFKDEFGFVHLRGAVEMGTSNSSIAFRLPKGARPVGAQGWAVLFQDSGGLLSGDGNLTIMKDGNAYVGPGGDGGFFGGERWGLDNIVFRTR